MVPALSIAAALASAAPSNIEPERRYSVKPVDDPLRLPYRINLYASRPFPTDEGTPGTGRLLPVQLDSNGTLGCIIIGNNWRPRALSTGIVMYQDIEYSHALTHLNIRTARIFSERVRDFDHDGHPELAVTYTTDDSLWLEILDFDSEYRLDYRRLLVAGEDRDDDDDDYWDGAGIICALYDFNGDGYVEFIVSTDVGYDLYPRLVLCLDWQRDSVLWQTPMSGIVGDSNVWIGPLMPNEPPSLVVQVSSKGNSAVAGDMTDEHSYLLVLDSQGKIRWKKKTGDSFYGGSVAVLEQYEPGRPAILSAQAFDSTVNGESQRWGSLVLYDGKGSTIDSVSFGPDRMVMNLDLVDLDGDGISEVAACLNNGTVIFYDQQMQPIEQVDLYTKCLIWGADDYLGRGDRQILAYTHDHRLWLFDSRFDPLAQLDIEIDPMKCSVFRRPGAMQSELSLKVDGGQSAALASFVEMPWSLIFYREPWLAFFVAFVPLSLVVIVLILWVRVWRHHNLLIADRNAQRAAHNAHRSLISSIAHRLRNSMSLAVLNTQTLRGRFAAELPEKPQRLLEQIEQSLRATSENITALSAYEKIQQELREDLIDVGDVAQQVVEAYRQIWEERGIDVQLECDDNPQVRANRTHIYLLFEVLLKNGVEALAKSASPRITIAVGAEMGRVSIEYVDNGPGIDSMVLAKLGKEIVSTKPTTGLGIGVLSVHEVVGAYGGSMKFTNQESGGVRIYILLPKAS